MINYKDHNNYLVNERKMMSVLKLLKQEIETLKQQNAKLKAQLSKLLTIFNRKYWESSEKTYTFAPKVK